MLVSAIPSYTMATYFYIITDFFCFLRKLKQQKKSLMKACRWGRPQLNINHPEYQLVKKENLLNVRYSNYNDLSD
jgi:hypothetical protein